jgi:hypothetical protein
MEAGDKMKSVPRSGLSAWIMILLVAGTNAISWAVGAGVKANRLDNIQQNICKLEAEDVALRLEIKKGCDDTQTLKEFVAAQKVLNDVMEKRLGEILAEVRKR